MTFLRRLFCKPKDVDYAGLGKLTWDCNGWSGHLPQAGSSGLLFWIYQPRRNPDPELCEFLLVSVAMLDDLVAEARKYIAGLHNSVAVELMLLGALTVGRVDHKFSRGVASKNPETRKLLAQDDPFLSLQFNLPHDKNCFEVFFVHRIPVDVDYH